MALRFVHLIFILLFSFTMAQAQQVYYLDEMHIERIEQGWGSAQANKTMRLGAIRLGGRTYARGVGTHADMSAEFKLDGQGERFEAFVGLDDTVATLGGYPIQLRVLADGKEVFSTPQIRPGSGGVAVSVPLAGVRVLMLKAVGLGGTNHTHVDLAEARITMVAGSTLKPDMYVPPAEAAYILTPAAPAAPRLTGPRRYGVRPGTELVHTLTATGKRPMRFEATGLPPGISLHGATGRLSGKASGAEGNYKVTVRAIGASGRAERVLEIVVGQEIALTPPMGWNSWNCWGMSVTADKVRRSAKAMVSSGLADHGWAYINVDDGWQAPRANAQAPIGVNDKFTDMAHLAADIHALGLRAGIYSTPWATSYGGLTGGSYNTPEGKVAHSLKGFGLYSGHEQDAKAFGEWGYDYLKYDWYPNDELHIRAMAEALGRSGRSIVYSLSNTASLQELAKCSDAAQAWRTTGDIIDTWSSLASIAFQQDKWEPLCRPGHWPDPDMLIVGNVGWGDKTHPTRLTPSEQYTHISAWALFSAPLLLGCDLETLDPFTLNLLCNDDVLDVNQDPAGRHGQTVLAEGDIRILAKPLADGSMAVGLFNLGREARTITLPLSALPTKPAKARLRDLWRQKEIGTHTSTYTSPAIPSHGVMLLTVRP